MLLTGLRPIKQNDRLSDDEYFRVKRTAYRNQLWKKIDYVPHPKQREVHTAIARGAVRVALNWGRRTGKTICGGTEILTDFKFASTGKIPHRMKQIAGPKAEVTDRVFEYLWRWIVKENCLDCQPLYKSARERYIEMPWGSRVEGKTTDDPDSLLGEGVFVSVVDEHARNKPDVLKKYILPPLFDTGGICMLTSTPKGSISHFKDTCDEWAEKMSEGNLRFFYSHATSYDNPYVNINELEEYRLSCEQTGMMDLFYQEIMAQFTVLSGAIYPNFAPMKDGQPWHVQEFDPFPGVPFELGVDWGFQAPFVTLFCQYVNEVLYICDEIYHPGWIEQRCAEEVVKKAESWKHLNGNDVDVNLCPDCGFQEDVDETEFIHGFMHYSSCPECRSGNISKVVEKRMNINYAYCDPENASAKANFLENNIPIYEPDGTEEIPINSVTNGINWVRSFYGRPDKPAVVICKSRCPNTIRETQGYVRKKDGSEKPLEQNDHTQDAKRYVTVGVTGCKNYEPVRLTV